MLKTLIGATAMLLAASAVPAAAHDWDDYGGYPGYYGSYGGDYDGDYDRVAAEHVRACLAHQRFHETLNAVHERQEAYGDSYASDQALNEAEEEYHESHRGLGNCDYWFNRYYGGYGGY